MIGSEGEAGSPSVSADVLVSSIVCSFYGRGGSATQHMEIGSARNAARSGPIEAARTHIRVGYGISK